MGGVGPRDRGEVLHRRFRRLCLPSAALAADHERLVASLPEEIAVGGIGDGVRMRRHHPDALATVILNCVGRVKLGNRPIGVHREKDVRSVRVDAVNKEAPAEVVKNVGVVQMRQGGVVFAASVRVRVVKRPDVGPADNFVVLPIRVGDNHRINVVIDADHNGLPEAMRWARHPDRAIYLKGHDVGGCRLRASSHGNAAVTAAPGGPQNVATMSGPSSVCP
mmetsp:Transcript_17462/g.47783  ORF Transcript_17462/g.47783 Transcript_17462/m.47783 type:complete len:221 (-) Transcript_17462:16-678(-)